MMLIVLFLPLGESELNLFVCVVVLVERGLVVVGRIQKELFLWLIFFHWDWRSVSSGPSPCSVVFKKDELVALPNDLTARVIPSH
jgi:hypothetical protein